MSDQSEQTEEYQRQRADTFSAVLPVVAIVFALAAIFGFLWAGWIVALSFLALALIFFALGAILDLQLEISRRLKRLESKDDKQADKR